MTRRTTRRDFLRGRSAADAPSDSADRRDPVPATASPDTYLLRVTRDAMACQFEAVFNAGQYPDAADVAVEAMKRIGDLEEQLSFFRIESEISRLNLLAARGPVEVEPGLFDLLRAAQELSRETDGAWDLTAAPLWEVWGFARRAGRIPDESEIAEARQRVGYQYVELDPAGRTVRFTRPGVKLNLGSIGKGYALDKAAELLLGAGIADFLFHGGNSSVLARGSRMEAGRTAGGWTVGVRHPLDPARRWAEVQLRDRALGTSGGTFQFFRHQGKRYVHILDPRTGRPADGVLSVTVIAPSAALADALSTAFFVLGPEKARELCERRPEVAAVITTPRKGTGFAIHWWGMADRGWRWIEPGEPEDSRGPPG